MSTHIQLRQVLDAFEVQPPGSFRFRGGETMWAKDFPPMPQGPGHPFHPMSENPLVRAIQIALYRNCYSHSFDSPLKGEQQPAVPSEDLINRLAAANASRSKWEKGWRVYQAQWNGQ